MNFKSCATALIFSVFASFPLISVADISNEKGSIEQTQMEGKLLGILSVINNNEIAAGNLAISKASSSDVKNFASLMVKDHSENLAKSELLMNKLGLKPIEGPIAMKLKNKGKKELASLNDLQGSAFDKAYMGAMVKGHKEALDLVTTLINKASNPLVKEHLESTKTRIEQHLENAKTIMQSLH